MSTSTTGPGGWHPGPPEIEEFVQVVMASWRADGGEPDIGLDLPGWLAELGFTTTSLWPIIDVVPAFNPPIALLRPTWGADQEARTE